MNVNSGAKKVKQISRYINIYIWAKKREIIEKNHASLFLSLMVGQWPMHWIGWTPIIGSQYYNQCLQHFGQCAPKYVFFGFVIRDTFNLISFSFVFCIKIISPILSQNILFSIHKKLKQIVSKCHSWKFAFVDLTNFELC